MISTEALLTLYSFNHKLITRQCEGMSHTESLIQPPFEANCINWILGHLISARTSLIKLVGEEPVWTDEIRARYRFGSQPITEDGEGVLLLERLLADFNESQVRLERGLRRMTAEDLLQPSGFQANTITDTLLYYQFHEAHHAGQMTILAPLAGKPGAWIA